MAARACFFPASLLRRDTISSIGLPSATPTPKMRCAYFFHKRRDVRRKPRIEFLQRRSWLRLYSPLLSDSFVLDSVFSRTLKTPHVRPYFPFSRLHG